MEMKSYLPNKSKVNTETYNLRGVPEVTFWKARLIMLDNFPKARNILHHVIYAWLCVSAAKPSLRRKK